MKAALVLGRGGPERIVVREASRPVPGRGQVLVRVRAASVNPLDWKLRHSRFRFLYGLKFPFIPGFDYVGTDATLALAVGATRSLGKVSQIGLAGGAAHMQVLENTRFEVQFEATLWGTIKELREVIALAETGHLTPIAIELAPLAEINKVYARLKRGDVSGRVVITPAA